MLRLRNVLYNQLCDGKSAVSMDRKEDQITLRKPTASVAFDTTTNPAEVNCMLHSALKCVHC